MSPVPLVRVFRSSLEESVHFGDVAAADAQGRVVRFAGDPERVVFARSSMKPLQAAVSLSLAPLPFSDREVAVMCASHNAEPVHLEAVRAVLARAGVGEPALRCPQARPWDDEAAAHAPERRAINHDCSGKHAGMLAACRHQGWPQGSYREPGHPLQRAILTAVLAAAGVEDVVSGVDGCGVPVHGMPLRSMATIYARLSVPDVLGPIVGEARRAIAAMRAEPYMVAGRNRVDTAVMEQVPGVVIKAGAEGLICASLLESGIGIAVKIRDGSSRAGGPALIHALRLLRAMSAESVEQLARFARPPVLGGGERVGELVPGFTLEPA